MVANDEPLRGDKGDAPFEIGVGVNTLSPDQVNGLLTSAGREAVVASGVQPAVGDAGGGAGGTVTWDSGGASSLGSIRARLASQC